MKKRMPILNKVEIAMEKAVEKILVEYERTGNPLTVWKNGIVKKITLK